VKLLTASFSRPAFIHLLQRIVLRNMSDRP
jgi:hypothetical protein